MLKHTNVQNSYFSSRSNISRRIKTRAKNLVQGDRSHVRIALQSGWQGSSTQFIVCEIVFDCLRDHLTEALLQTIKKRKSDSLQSENDKLRKLLASSHIFRRAWLFSETWLDAAKAISESKLETKRKASQSEWVRERKNILLKWQIAIVLSRQTDLFIWASNVDRLSCDADARRGPTRD